MDIRTLEGIDYKDILNVFNESFSDYFVPFKLSEEQLISKINTDNTDLELSVGVFDNQRLVAFILHGIEIINNQNVAYNGATGVIPQKRGSGLTKQMYLFILPILGWYTPPNIRSIVLLPEPFSPIMPSRSPRFKLRLILVNA